MDYRLLEHDEYQKPDHIPARALSEGETVTLLFQGLEGYKITEPRRVKITSKEGEGFVGQLLEPGMIVPIRQGETVRFAPRHAFEPPAFGDETLFA